MYKIYIRIAAKKLKHLKDTRLCMFFLIALDILQIIFYKKQENNLSREN